VEPLIWPEEVWTKLGIEQHCVKVAALSHSVTQLGEWNPFDIHLHADRRECLLNAEREPLV